MSLNDWCESRKGQERMSVLYVSRQGNHNRERRGHKIWHRTSTSARIHEDYHATLTINPANQITALTAAYLRSENILASIMAEVATLNRLVASIIDLSSARPSLRSPTGATTEEERAEWEHDTGTTVAEGDTVAGEGAREGGISCTKNHFTAQGEPRWFSSSA